MKPKELQEFLMLHRVFIKDCHRVAGILKNLERNKRCDGSDIRHADEFHVEGSDVEWSGYEFWGGCDGEHHSGSFPAEYLTMDDDELTDIVERDNCEYRRECDKKKKEMEEHRKNIRREEYERLKKEFGE